MNQLSINGQQAVNDIAQRHGFGTDAVASMLDAVLNGNGRMAQFNHPEFSGAGQWMNGGMTMVSDMFNNQLKGRVDALCCELARLVANQPDLRGTGSFQSQSQNGQQQNNYSGQPPQNGNVPANPSASLFVPSADWWPADLRWPNSTGAQNGVRYAYFAQARRLVIELNGSVTVYDTQDHQIGGFSQQQSQGGSVTFSSQHGPLDVTGLPIVSVDGIYRNQPGNPVGMQLANPELAPDNRPPPPAWAAGATAGDADICAMIEKLADLHSRAILSDTEFNAKKTELLARL